MSGTSPRPPDPAARTGQPVTIVDAFTAEPFLGNPAGVCVLAEPAPEGWMRLVARELSLSETAFVHPEGNGYRLRWFTPAAEVELCGHATLATAHVLWEDGVLGPDEVARFSTLSGELRAERIPASDGPAWIELDLPAIPLAPAEAPSGLLEALGVEDPSFVGRSGDDYVIQVASEDVVRSLSPNVTLLVQTAARTVAVTAVADGVSPPDEGPAVVSRFFGPKMGVTEDPVTGFAHCMIGPLCRSRRGWESFLAYQASARGGYLRVTVAGDRVRLAGQAVTVLRGRLLATP